MNYISEINSFNDWLETNQVPKSAIALWHAIMHINNKAGWVEWFDVAISVLEFKTGFKRSELFAARNVLAQKGRLEWKSRGGNLCASYRVIPFCVHNTDASTNTNEYANTNANGNANPTQTDTINKLNKTKLNKEDPPLPPKGDSPELLKTDFDFYVSEFNRICVSLPKIQKLSDSRKKKLSTREKDFGREKILEVFKLAEESDFLSGRSDKWQASFDWLMEPKNLLKVLEGNYKNKMNNENNPRIFIGEQSYGSATI